MSTFLELMNYCLYQCLAQRLSRENAFKLFKEHCLRHAVQRPPHSLGVFNLVDVKAICSHGHLNFLRFYQMYMNALIPELHIEIETNEGQKVYEIDYPKPSDIEEAEEINHNEIEDLKLYFSEKELD